MSLLSLFRRRSSLQMSHHPRLTWASQSLGTAVSRTGIFIKRQIWVWPIIATVLLAIIGFVVHSSIAKTMKDNLRSQLQTLLKVETEMLENWIDTNSANASSLANSQAVRESVYQLLEALEPDESGKPRQDVAEVRRALNKQVGPTLSSHEYAGYLVVDKSRRIVASSAEELIGMQAIPEYEAILKRALQGETTICAPFGSVVSMKDESGRLRTGVPTMFVSAPIRDASFEIVAALALRIQPEREFTEILQLGEFGQTGETYAFDKTGLMVSSSRFDESLILAGILPDREDSRSILNVQLRDPGGNMADGYRPKSRRADQPLTKSAMEAIAGRQGDDIEGYRDYRGVPVLGGLDLASEVRIRNRH